MKGEKIFYFIFFAVHTGIFLPLIYMKANTKILYMPVSNSRSTFLVPEYLYNRYVKKGRVAKLGLASYLHRLMEDPELSYKLSLLKPKKWKKHYQPEGQILHRINFYPGENDWARLSMISNGTGFSRCYIFVFLLLLYEGVIKQNYGGTPSLPRHEKRIHITLCSIFLDTSLRKLTRTLQT